MPIFDQGYQHWSGQLSGHATRWLAVARHSIRATIRGRLVKIMLIMAWAPAIALVTFLALWGLLEQRAETILSFVQRMQLPSDIVDTPQTFRSAVWTIAYSFFFKAELTAALFLVLVVGPSLVSRDLRFNAFPLYFSRPLRRFDYFIGKLAVIGFFLLAVAVGPAVVAYIFGLAFSLDIKVLRDTHRLLWGGILYGTVIAVSAGTLMLALSSLSRRSIYVGLAWAGFWFLTAALSGILIGVRIDADRRHFEDEAMTAWLADHPTPPGIEIRGRYSISRRWSSPEEQREQSRWLAARDEVLNRARGNIVAETRSDWRRVISYYSNLDRIGDWLLGTDRAWVTIGGAIDKQRKNAALAASLRGHFSRDLFGQSNDRFLADQMVLQYPVIWSVGILAGLWLLSALILTTRVKSLDRLK